MPLSPGTALQNGHYVIDALLDAAPNGDLHWGTHVVSGTQVFIQVFQIAPTVSAAEVSALIARWQGVAFSPRSPLPNPFQLFHGEDRALCLAMGCTIGLPWSSLCGTVPADNPRNALTRIHTLASAVLWLKKQGINHIDLSPNRVWFTETGDRLSLTGLPYTHLSPPEGQECLPTPTPVQCCARLLYSFLMGQWPTIEEPHELQQALEERLPNLSPRIQQAICQGLATPSGEQAEIDLAQWIAQLPPPPELLPLETGQGAQPEPSSPQVAPKPSAFPLGTPVATQIVSTYRPAPASAPTTRSWRMKKRYPALLLTAIAAAIAGVGLGTVWRIHAKNLPGTLQLEPNQSFPPQADWPGDTPEAGFDNPFFPAQENPDRPAASFSSPDNAAQEEPLRAPEPDADALEATAEDLWEPSPEVVPEEPVVESSPEPAPTALEQPNPPDWAPPPSEEPSPMPQPEAESPPLAPSPTSPGEPKALPENKEPLSPGDG